MMVMSTLMQLKTSVEEPFVVLDTFINMLPLGTVILKKYTSVNRL
jgi:hypothetical protein